MKETLESLQSFVDRMELHDNLAQLLTFNESLLKLKE